MLDASPRMRQDLGGIMKILYGVVGEGMGHATRSRVVLEHLLKAGHEVRVVVSGRAHRFLTEKLARHENATLHEIKGLTLRYLGNRVDRSDSLFDNLRKSPQSIYHNVQVYRDVAEAKFVPDVVFSDFESWAAFYAVNRRLPVISIDNMQIINRCKHDKTVKNAMDFDFELARLAIKMKLPGAYHYLVSSFFYPPVRKKYTTLVPPIVRPEVLNAQREPRDHVLVYQTASSNQELIPTLQTLPYQFRLYGMGRSGVEKNVRLCEFSEQGFIDDLRTARAVIAGGGFSLMSEAVTLRVPMLSVPVERQAEQQLNGRYLAKLGYGRYAPILSRDGIVEFLDRLGAHQTALDQSPRYDVRYLHGCVDELLTRIARGEKRPKALETPAPRKYGDPGGRGGEPAFVPEGQRLAGR